MFVSVFLCASVLIIFKMPANGQEDLVLDESEAFSDTLGSSEGKCL